MKPMCVVFLKKKSYYYVAFIVGWKPMFVAVAGARRRGEYSTFKI
jgi:hypothetical protein